MHSYEILLLAVVAFFLTGFVLDIIDFIRIRIAKAKAKRIIKKLAKDFGIPVDVLLKNLPKILEEKTKENA